MQLNYEKSLKLLELIRASKHLDDSEAEQLVYALAQIQNSLDRVYKKILPKVFSEKKLSKKSLSNFYDDLEKEICQIDSHIHSTNMVI